MSNTTQLDTIMTVTAANKQVKQAQELKTAAESQLINYWKGIGIKSDYFTGLLGLIQSGFIVEIKRND